MSGDIIVHPIAVRLRPHPNWDRFRIALAALLLGEFEFQGELLDVSGHASKPIRQASPQDQCP